MKRKPQQYFCNSGVDSARAEPVAALNTNGASALVTDKCQIGPVPEGRGEPSDLKVIRIGSFTEKSDKAWRFCVLNRSLRRFTPALLHVEAHNRHGCKQSGDASPTFTRQIPRRSQTLDSPRFLARKRLCTPLAIDVVLAT